jgi:hypothetical protein
MNELDRLLVQIIALEGGTVVGKTRLQKMLYLLDQCGLNSGCRYDYRHFGPFSTQIAESAEDVCELNILRYEEKPGFHAVPYGVYQLAKKIEVADEIGSLPRFVVEEKLAIMRGYTAIDLELAATLKYLRNTGMKNPVEALKDLKPAKSTPDRLRKAQELLREMGL